MRVVESFRMNIDINALVDAERGLIGRSIFIDPQIYEQECRRVFTRCWMYLCHESQIPRPGDFCTAYIAEDPVIAWRDTAGTVRAFLNVCRHRGNRLCRADSGNATALTCAYHGWTYGNDGKLKGVPRQEAAYRGELDRERWPLTAVARVDSYKGLVFATFDAAAPPLREYLGELTWYLDAIFDRREGGVEVFPGVHKWIVPCNWKIAAENFSGDSYHGPWAHRSAMSAGFSARRARPSDVNRFHLYVGNGHCVMARQPDDASDSPPVVAYEQEGRPRVRERLGPRIDLVRPAVATVFPNFAVVRGTANSMRVWHPRGPDRTEIWSWIFVDREAPAAVKETVRLASLRSFGPAGTFEQDDIDNWQECTQTARGVISRNQVLNLQMGLGQERFDPALGAWTTDFCTSESNQRHFYRYWAELMSLKRRSALEAVAQ
jgi:phenylpropionate dioxygenase-like ring-hydroxylating dioxygenase large terminal subunit